MKLAKKISKGIALCAALVIMGAMGGVITSCSNGSEDTNPIEDPKEDPDPETPADEENESKLELTSIIKGIVAEENVWDSGTSITKTDDVYVVVAGKGWDKEGMASIPVSFAAGDLDGYEFIVLDGVDISGFKLRDDNDEYPSIELKITYKVGEEEKSKIISATKLLKDNKIEIPLANVEDDFLKKGSQIMLSFRGTGTVKIKDISKAKAKVTTPNPDGSQTTPPATKPEVSTPSGTTPVEADKKDEEDKKEDEDDKKEEENPPAKPEETVIYKLDFSGEKAPENYYCDEEKFEANVGAKIEGAWNNFSIVPVNDASALKDATHIRVTFKCSSDAAFADGDVDNNKFMVGLYKDGGEDNNYAETNVRWTCFLNANEDDFPKDFTLVEKKINWEQKYESDGTTKMPLADFEYTSNFRIWDCNFVTGTLIVQSIEFIKK